MKDIFKGYSLKQFNTDINGLIKDETVNNIKLFAATDEAKISVVLRPSTDKFFYHGLHPSFSSEKMIDLLVKRKESTKLIILKSQIKPENKWKSRLLLQDEIIIISLNQRKIVNLL